MSQDDAKKDEPPKGTPEELEILNEEFELYRVVANSLIRTYIRPKDIEIGNSLLQLCIAMKDNEDIRVKREANKFYKFLISVLNWTSVHQPLKLYECWYKQKSDDGAQATPWLQPGKAYVSTKRLADGSTIVYTAMSTVPNDGWQEKGLKLLYEEKQNSKN